MDADFHTRLIDKQLRTAIGERRVIAFKLDGFARIAEPHDYGVVEGERRLFFYQLGGESRSGRPLGWRWAKLSKIAELQLLERRFRGTRPAPSGRHVEWEQVLASVSRRSAAESENP